MIVPSINVWRPCNQLGSSLYDKTHLLKILTIAFWLASHNFLYDVLKLNLLSTDPCSTSIEIVELAYTMGKMVVYITLVSRWAALRKWCAHTCMWFVILSNFPQFFFRWYVTRVLQLHPFSKCLHLPWYFIWFDSKTLYSTNPQML